MDTDIMLRQVNNLNEYIACTQEIAAMQRNFTKMQFNMSSVLSLKKVRALEIEYFNKCEGNGAALIIFERMLDLPPSKTWLILGKELVSILQYWLDAMRKHLIKHNIHWWSFMKLLLKFINKIRNKDKSFHNILVEHTAECLLDLATCIQPDTVQRYEILSCLNLCCADSSREIRFALRNKFECYFTKLSTLIPSVGHVPAQCSMLEVLLRWLLPRHEPAVRRAAADAWFPRAVYGPTAVDVFLERPWQDFLQDARDFVNAYNETKELVASAICRRLTVGSVQIIAGTERREFWLDVNSSNKSVTVILDPKTLISLGLDPQAWETLVVEDEELVSVQLSREFKEVTLSIHTSCAPRLSPSGVAAGDTFELRAVLSAARLDRMHRALRNAFQNKYQDKEVSTRFSDQKEVLRRKRSGVMVGSRHPLPWRSPSTASTSSLAQLHDKLASLPQYKFDKEPVHVCALPELSTVTEVTETDEGQTLNSTTSTIKINRPFGVCHKNIRNTERKSQSDGEIQSELKVGRYLSPAVKEDYTTSCLLEATIGSDESVINDTLERLTKNKDFNPDKIVDLLVQEALQKDVQDREMLDSGINTGDKKTQDKNEVYSEAVENTPDPNSDRRKNKQDCEKSCTIISNTTTDESNDVTSNFVTKRQRQQDRIKQPERDGHAFDVQDIENFFSQHIAENPRGEMVISPILARKINESTSESDPFDDCIMNQDNEIVEQNITEDVDIIACLNDMVDKVCSDLEKCNEILNKEANEMNIIDIANDTTEKHSKAPLRDLSNTVAKGKKETVNSVEKKPKAIKLKYNTRKTKTRGKAKNKNNKLELKSVSPMSPIVEAKDSVDNIEVRASTPQSKKESSGNKSTSDELDMPVIRRKRKLYSPKYVNVDEKRNFATAEIEDNEFKTTKINTPKHTATSYKDIERDRQARIRKLRTRKSKATVDSPSPRTKKMNDIFDHLKEDVEPNNNIILANKKSIERDMAVYNFTSDSEDEDFKKKKIEIQKRISSTTIASGDSSMSTRHGRTVTRVNYSENKSSDETNKKIKKTARRKKRTKTRLVKPEKDLVDEQMRKAAPENLNASLIVEKNDKEIIDIPNPIISNPPQMETIQDEPVVQEPQKRSRAKKTNALRLKKGNRPELNTLEIDRVNDDRTESPLPGLVVEQVHDNKEDVDDSVTANMIQIFKKVYQEGPEALINESNATQNLLSDVEKINYSPQPMNITEELNKIERDVKLVVVEENPKPSMNLRAKNKDVIIDLDKESARVERSQILKIKQEISANRKRNIETVDLVSEVKSEISIATVGKSPITAHGDNNEAPPDTELLTENLKPRDLEIEDLNESIQDYFKKLRQEIMEPSCSKRVSTNSEETKLIRNSSRECSMSPVVSIARMSLDDISKWLPSRRNSDTDSSYSSHKPKTDNSVCKKDDSRSDPKFDQLLGDANQVPCKHKKEVRKKDEGISKLESPKEVCRARKKIAANDETENSSKIIEQTHRIQASKKKIPKQQESSDEVQELVNTKGLRSRKKPENPDRKIEKSISDNSQSPINEIPQTPKKTNKKVVRKSMISPIILFDELFPINRDASSDEDCEATKNTLIKKQDRKTKEIVEESTNAVSTPSSIIETKMRKRKTSTPEECAKRRRLSPEVESPKRRRDEVVTISDSGPSILSVNEWFKRNALDSRAESENTSLKDSIQNVLEKLDTTLAEIHQTTSKKFIHMFVDAQKSLVSMKAERRRQLRGAAADLLAAVVKVVDDKFADLDRRSQEMDAHFMEQLKSQAAQLIREDCRRKQAMVAILREDVQAVIDHAEGRGRIRRS